MNTNYQIKDTYGILKNQNTPNNTQKHKIEIHKDVLITLIICTTIIILTLLAKY